MSEQPLKDDKVTPHTVMQDLWAGWRAQALVAAIELEVFTHISQGKRTAKEIASASSSSDDGMRRLLDAMVGLGYLDKTGDKYKLEPVSDTFLVRGNKSYLGEMAYITRNGWDSWSHLTDVVRTGQPMETIDAEEKGREFFPKLISALFPVSYTAARAAVSGFSEDNLDRIGKILDVAAGSAAWSIAFAEAVPGSMVTVIDFPEVTRITRQFVEKFKMSDRYVYLEGNMREINFGEKQYDLIILGQIIHSEGKEFGEKLINRSYRALKDRGMLLIAEMVPNDTRTAPVMPLLFALNMLIQTENGDVFTMREYKNWLEKAGFNQVTTIDVPAPSPLILAKK